MEAPVRPTLATEQGFLRFEPRWGRAGRSIVGHVENGGHAPGEGGAASVGDTLLGAAARFAEMRVRVDQPGKCEKAGGVEDLTAGIVIRRLDSQRMNRLALDPDRAGTDIPVVVEPAGVSDQHSRASPMRKAA